MTAQPATKTFRSVNRLLTRRVVADLDRCGRHSAVIAEAPPGAGKSTLIVSVAHELLGSNRRLVLPIITQTNEQADDLALALADRDAKVRVARLVGHSSTISPAIRGDRSNLVVVEHSDDAAARIVVGTARKWEYERARLQRAPGTTPYLYALIDEAYQMRSDALLGVASLFDTLFCVGDPGQLDPFTTVDDSIWKGLTYSPSRSAVAVLRAYHQDIAPILLDTSWRLPPSAATLVAQAFYPEVPFGAGTTPKQRRLRLGRHKQRVPNSSVDTVEVLQQAAKTGWGYVELPERFTVRTDHEVAAALAALVCQLLASGATVTDERAPTGRPMTARRVAVIAAHNDQVHAVRYELSRLGIDPDSVVVSTANKIQGREYDVTFIWHPLAGRRDATAFHLEAGRMCVMLSRHRQACVVVGRAGAERLLREFPDSDPIFLDEPEKFPDGWEANHEVLRHLAGCRV